MKKIYIIAEIGNSHEGSVGLAKCFIKTAAECGADAVKFQTHIFDAESLPNAPCPSYFKDESRQRYFERTAFNTSQYFELKHYAEIECGIDFLSSVFSIEAFNLLEHVGIKQHKIPSGEITNIPLLEKVASSGKPVLLSSGMSSWSELDDAVETLHRNQSGPVTVFQCTSVYPCPPEKVGLNVLGQIKKRYGVEVGFSDHTLGVSAALGAVMLEATAIEKHLTLSRRLYGSDAKHSLEPSDFIHFTQTIRELEQILACPVEKNAMAEELIDMKYVFEKSIVAKTSISPKTVITPDMIGFKKPGNGIKASQYREIIGKIAKQPIPENCMITWDMLE